MRQFLIAYAALLALTAPALAVTAPPLPSIGQVMAQRFSPAELQQLKRISTYLNTLKNVEGKFLQIAANGTTDQGNFFIRKPGRTRFEYAKPNPTLIVADGNTVAVANSALKTTDRYPLVNSPLRLLLSENVDLTRDTRIVSLKSEKGLISVTARENTAAVQGSITLTFADTGTTLELRQWEVVDAQGSRTAIVVNDMRQVADIPARLFVIEDLSPFK